MDITLQTALRDLLAAYPRAARILREFGMQCVGCSSLSAETLKEACAVHHINADELLYQLWEYAAEVDPD